MKTKGEQVSSVSVKRNTGIMKKKRKNAMKAVESSAVELPVLACHNVTKKNRKRKKVNDHINGDKNEKEVKVGEFKRIKAIPAALKEGEEGMSKSAKKRKRKNNKNKTTDDCKEETGDEPRVKKLKVVSESSSVANNEGSEKLTSAQSEHATLTVKKKKKKRKNKNVKKDAESVLPMDVMSNGDEKSNESKNNGDENMNSSKKKKKEKKKAENRSAANGNPPVNKKEDEKMEVQETNEVSKKKNYEDESVASSASVEAKKSEAKYVREVCAKFNKAYSDQPNKEQIAKCWKESSSLQKDNGFELLNEPFKCAYMPKFFYDAAFLQNVKTELSYLDYLAQNNDLYKFHQTSDLKSVSSPYIASLREFLYGDFRRYLSEVTNIELSDTVDMASSQYRHTDGLLCHDDKLEGRRLAYVLYLTPPWYVKDGGTLDLFNVDGDGHPRDVVKSLQPKWNTFTFFEVSPVSYHQVREVLAQDKVRLSINGWFHGPTIERPPKHVISPRSLLSPLHLEEEEFYSWINPYFLDASTQKEIRKKFQNDSEIELESFLCDEKYKELSNVLPSLKLKWLSTGPANKQSCQVLKEEKLPETITSCTNFLKSEALFLVLSQLTGLKLHHLAPPDSDPDSEDEEIKDSSPGMTLDIRKWSHGCYTLVRDSDREKSCTLDATLFVNVVDSWALKHGAFTSYIAKDEDEELLTVVPRSNCFAMVYRDIETLKFTKYVNVTSKDFKRQQDNVFYDFSCTYKE